MNKLIYITAFSVLIKFCINSTIPGNISYQYQDENFVNCLFDVYDSVLYNKRDLIIATDGRKTVNRYLGPISKRSTNVVTIFTQSYFIEHFESFSRNESGQDYGLIILSECDNAYIETFINLISFNHLYVVLAFYKQATDECLTKIIEQCKNSGLFHTSAIINNHTKIRVIQSVYDIIPDCKRIIRLKKHTWSPGKTRFGFSEKHRPNMRGCVVNVSTLNIPPNVIMKKTSSSDYKGYEMFLVYTLSKDMNFTLNILEQPTLIWGGLDANKTPYGILGDVYSGISDIAFGVIWPTNSRKSFLDLSLSFGTDCLGCIVPKNAARRSTFSKMSGFLLKGFKIRSWSCILVSIILSIIFFIFHAAFFNKCNKKNVFSSTCVGVMITTSLLVQKPVPWTYATPRLCSFKIIFVFWLFWSQIISAVYTGFLSGLLVVPDIDYDIDSFPELLDSGLPIGTTNDLFSIVNGFSDDEPIIGEIKKRIKVKSPASKYVGRIVNGSNTAYCRNYATLVYIRNEQKVDRRKIHVLKDCFLNYPIVLALRKGSLFTHRTNVIISRLRESGILGYWNPYTYALESKIRPTSTKFHPEKFGKIIYIFYFYGFGNTLSGLVFICEIIHYRRHNKCEKLAKKAERPKHILESN